jgi:hypothetical protein
MTTSHCPPTHAGTNQDDDFPALLFSCVALVFTLSALMLSFFTGAAAVQGNQLTRTDEFKGAGNHGGFAAVVQSIPDRQHLSQHPGVQMAVVPAVPIPAALQQYDPATPASLGGSQDVISPTMTNTRMSTVQSSLHVPAPLVDLIDNEGRPISL